MFLDVSQHGNGEDQGRALWQLGTRVPQWVMAGVRVRAPRRAAGRQEIAYRLAHQADSGVGRLRVTTCVNDLRGLSSV